ncbi:hypothetical protein HJFPF1_00801 [Paramyrothecium foliicola]|nr:hypothetical protein HJFPF1_00801 [Paramyrothecium foliicola]
MRWVWAWGIDIDMGEGENARAKRKDARPGGRATQTQVNAHLESKGICRAQVVLILFPGDEGGRQRDELRFMLCCLHETVRGQGSQG